jgi:hypothetical protein
MTKEHFDPALLKEFQQRFFAAKTQSIDRFIQYNEAAFGRIGRLHIAATILNCEDDRSLDGDWYALLLDEIFPRGPVDLSPGDLSVVTFNYDRSFEQFFTSAFTCFGLTPQEAATQFAKINVVHVYGQLGELAKVPYGDFTAAPSVAETLNLIRHDQPNANAPRINEAIAGAENVCFLGFAFAPENLALFDQQCLKGRRFYATSLGLPLTRVAEVKRHIRGIQFVDGTAVDMFREKELFRGKEEETDAPPKPRRTGVRPPRGENWVLGGNDWRLR